MGREVECNGVGEERSVSTVVGMDKSEEVGYAARGNVTRDGVYGVYGVYGAYIVEKEERVDEKFWHRREAPLD
jgi:hypothetical protein